MLAPFEIGVVAHDLSRIIDPVGVGLDCAGEIQRNVRATGVKKGSMRGKPHDLSRVINTVGRGELRPRYIEGCVAATAVEKAVDGELRISA